MAKLLLTTLFFLLTACSHTLHVPTPNVHSDSTKFQSQQLKKKSICLVITPEFRDYTFTKEAYNWAGGSLAPDTITFELGESLTQATSDMTTDLFANVVTVNSLDETEENAIMCGNYIIAPQIIKSSLDLPVVRFTNITAEIEVRYKLYSLSRSLLRKETVKGNGDKRLIFTKGNYAIAFGLAMEDLIHKTKFFLNDALP